MASITSGNESSGAGKVLLCVALLAGGGWLVVPHGATSAAPVAIHSASSTVPATQLKPGDRILIGPDRTGTVEAPTERDSHGGCVIHTDQGPILTGLPCDVTVIE